MFSSSYLLHWCIYKHHNISILPRLIPINLIRQHDISLSLGFNTSYWSFIIWIGFLFSSDFVFQVIILKEEVLRRIHLCLSGFFCC